MMTMMYTALGDSLSVGTIPFLNNSFVKKYKALLEKNLQHNVITNTIGKKRINSTELLQMLIDPQTRWKIANSDIITIAIGGNDLLQANRRFLKTGHPIEFQHALYTYSLNMKEMINLIKTLKSNRLPQKPYIIQLLGIYNPYPHLNYSNYWIYKFNQTLRSHHGINVIYIDTFHLFQHHGLQTLTIDIHPNGRGHYLIAQQLWSSLSSRLAVQAY